MPDKSKEASFHVEKVEEGLVRVIVTRQDGTTKSFLLRVVPETGKAEQVEKQDLATA